jgi:hypothetical protein
MATVHNDPECFDTLAKSCENAARAALDHRNGRALTDTEWEGARASLIEFVTMLRSWEQNAGTNDAVPYQPRVA